MVSAHVQRQLGLSASARLVCHEWDDASLIVRLLVDGTEPARFAAGSPGAFARCTYARCAPTCADMGWCSRSKGDKMAASGMVDRAAPSPDAGGGRARGEQRYGGCVGATATMHS